MKRRKIMGNNPNPKFDYRFRRGEISTYGRAVASDTRLRLFMLLVGGAMLLACGALLVFFWSQASSLYILAVVTVAMLQVLGLWLIYRFVKQHFVKPGLAFRMWLQQVCDGGLDARINLPEDHPHYKELNFHTKNLASALKKLSDDMDTLVESQTMRLNDQKRVLELLFKLTADVSHETENEAAFETVCDNLAKWFQTACVSCYRSIEGESKMRCVATRHADRCVHEATSASFGESVELRLEQVPASVSRVELANRPDASQRWVPFFAGKKLTGVLVIEIETAELSKRVEIDRVLSTVSEQLSHLCGKQLVQEQMLESGLRRDRNDLAAEIHDSLAQTLLAVRYQATVLSEKDKIKQDDESYLDILKLISSIEEANVDVRGLIRENRSPLSEHRYADSLQEVIDQFSQASGVNVFFQSDDTQIRFTPREESVLQGIIGESLNNTNKYAQASMVRVYLQREPSGVRRVVIEDDGVGFEHPVISDSAMTANDSGERIGLTIMRERAVSIGAKLMIDSEPGEGTRVAISMPPLIESQRESA